MSRTSGYLGRSQQMGAAHRSALDHGTDLRLMRASNWLLVLNCVRERGALPRAEVARYTGLSRTTVGNIIDDLLAEGLVWEGDSERAIPSGGRRVIPVHFKADVAYILGVALGRHRLIMLLTDLAATIVARIEVPFPSQRGPDVCLPLLADAIHEFIASQSLSRSKVIGICIGMPGVIRHGVTMTPTIAGWEGTNVQQIVSDLIGQPIYVDNNARLGALAESRFGNGRGIESMLYVRVGTGIGGGLVLRGNLFRGGAGTAGEIGHMVVDPHGPACPCGNIGCLETFASKTAIVERVQRERPAIDNIVRVLEQADAGDPICIGSLHVAAENIGAVVVSLVNFISPALIVIDGSTMRAGELLLGPIREAVATKSLPTPRLYTRVLAGALGNTAIALGGIATVQDAIFRDGAALHSIAAQVRAQA